MKKLVFCFSVMMLFFGCKKYPDGPLLSLRTKEHRMVGNWDVEYFSVNGYDSTEYLRSQPFYGKYQFRKGDYSSGDFIFKNSSNSYTASGSWIFTNNKKYLALALTTPVPTNHIGPYAAEYVSWEIRKLKENELWLKTTYNGKEYFVKFKQ